MIAERGRVDIASVKRRTAGGGHVDCTVRRRLQGTAPCQCREHGRVLTPHWSRKQQTKHHVTQLCNVPINEKGLRKHLTEGAGFNIQMNEMQIGLESQTYGRVTSGHCLPVSVCHTQSHNQ